MKKIKPDLFLSFKKWLAPKDTGSSSQLLKRKGEHLEPGFGRFFNELKALTIILGLVNLPETDLTNYLS